MVVVARLGIKAFSDLRLALPKLADAVPIDAEDVFTSDDLADLDSPTKDLHCEAFADRENMNRFSNNLVTHQ